MLRPSSVGLRTRQLTMNINSDRNQVGEVNITGNGKGNLLVNRKWVTDWKVRSPVGQYTGAYKDKRERGERTVRWAVITWTRPDNRVVGYSRFQKFGEKLKTEIGLWELPDRTPEVALDRFCNYNYQPNA